MNSLKSIFKLIAPVVFLFITTITWGQQKKWENWNFLGLKIPVSENVGFRLSGMASFSPSHSYQLNFAQSSASFSMDISKTFSLEIGDKINFYPGSSKRFRNRFFAGAGLDNKFSRIVKAKHNLEIEFHDKNETRYRQRYIFTNSLSLRHRFSPLHLRPSISYSLYYNVGGNPVQYYDYEGKPTVNQTPDGFHRGRFYARLNSKINEHVQLSLYFMSQREFNFLAKDDKKINVPDPISGKIIRPFDDYNVAGLSLQFTL